jgi:hypothetical protein
MLICEKSFNLFISYEQLEKKMQEGILGCLDFSQNAIFLDEKELESPEWRLNFTIAHDSGHYIFA